MFVKHFDILRQQVNKSCKLLSLEWQFLFHMDYLNIFILEHSKNEPVFILYKPPPLTLLTVSAWSKSLSMFPDRHAKGETAVLPSLQLIMWDTSLESLHSSPEKSNQNKMWNEKFKNTYTVYLSSERVSVNERNILLLFFT